MRLSAFRPSMLVKICRLTPPTRMIYLSPSVGAFVQPSLAQPDLDAEKWRTDFIILEFETYSSRHFSSFQVVLRLILVYDQRFIFVECLWLGPPAFP